MRRQACRWPGGACAPSLAPIPLVSPTLSEGVTLALPLPMCLTAGIALPCRERTRPFAIKSFGQAARVEPTPFSDLFGSPDDGFGGLLSDVLAG